MRRADGDDNGIEQAGQFGHCDVATHFDIAKKRDTWMKRGLLEGAGNALGRLVVWGNAGPDQAIGAEEAVDECDLDAVAQRIKERVGRVESGRPGADDCNLDAHRPAPLKCYRPKARRLTTFPPCAAAH